MLKNPLEGKKSTRDKEQNLGRRQREDLKRSGRGKVQPKCRLRQKALNPPWESESSLSGKGEQRGARGSALRLDSFRQNAVHGGVRSARRRMDTGNHLAHIAG